MRTRTLIWIVVVWLILILISYYIVPYFIVVLEWFSLSLGLFIWALVQIGKMIKERRNLTRQRIFSALIICILFLLTFYRSLVNSLIEEADWYIFYSKRSEVVELVKEGKLTPNVSWNNVVCELPYEFPVISNGGNDICIFKSGSTRKVTVTFWVYRNFFNSPSTYFVYTDDPKEKEALDNLVKRNPQDNWKINYNWYRTFDE